MPRYIALIFDDEAAWDAPGAFERGMHLHAQFGQDFAGVLRGWGALDGQSGTTVLRAEGDDVVVTDGPYAEAKEALGGYYLFEVDDRAAALEVAARVPVLAGRIELRQITEFG